jgi:hypothetical protein
MLPKLIARLESHYGPQPKPLSDPWHLILWENVAYLAEDDRRRQAFHILKKYVGLKPQQIVAASDDALLEVTRHGILPKQFVKKLRDCARIMLDEFGGDLSAVLKLPLAKAKKALRKFPGIGEPGRRRSCFSPRHIQCWRWTRMACACCCGLGSARKIRTMRLCTAQFSRRWRVICRATLRG